MLTGCPNDDKWNSLAQQCADVLESERPNLASQKHGRLHRRGPFIAVPCGVSHGTGTTQPGNLHNSVATSHVLDKLCGMEPFRRLAGFATCKGLFCPED